MIAFFVFLLLVGIGFGKGKVYEIVEPDLLSEIERSKDRAISLMRREIEKAREKMENFKGEVLTPAKKRRVFYIDPTYCLEESIWAWQGNSLQVLYPKGYCFNPISYLQVDPPPMVVFNPCRKEEKAWVERFIKQNKNAVLVASGCPLKEVISQGWQVPVYYLLPDLKQKLRLRHTISIVSVDRSKKAIKVEEIDVKGNR